MVQQKSNQTGNKHFVCSLSGSQLMWQIYTGKSGTRYQNFNGIAWVLYFAVLDIFLSFFFFLASVLSHCTVTAKCVFAYVHIILHTNKLP